MKLTPAPLSLFERPIAHRGYHDLPQGRAENSMSAFRAAIEAGFAIECDLQVSRTGVPVVFHDPVLARMTGATGNVRDRSPLELEELRLLDTEDAIYSLTKHLQTVDGSVPLILELKGVEDEDAGFVEGVAQALRSYEGPVGVMSFDHWVCEQFKELMPDVPRGLTAEGDDSVYDTHMQAMKEYDLQFVSYSVDDLLCRFVWESRQAGLPVISWTVRDAEAIVKTRLCADQMTFEGFDPSELDDA